MGIQKRLLGQGGGGASPAHFFGPKTDFSLFFDRPRAMQALDRLEQRVLARTGAYGRTIIRNSMKSGGAYDSAKLKYSKPYDVPKYHSRMLKDRIWFYYVPDTKSVIVGALGFKGWGRVTPLNKASGAQLLEEGGNAIIRPRVAGKRPYIAHYKPRPYLDNDKNSAFDAMQAKLLKELRDNGL